MTPTFHTHYTNERFVAGTLMEAGQKIASAVLKARLRRCQDSAHVAIEQTQETTISVQANGSGG
jgi:hypothetical protein